MKKILISHSEEDKQYVDQLARDLEACGVAAWYGVYFHGNDRYKEKINQLVRDAAAVIVVWSDSSVQSSHVVHAAEKAGTMGKLISVGLESSLGPMSSSRPYGRDHIDLDDRHQLLKSIAKHGIPVKGVIDVLPERSIYYYIMTGICLVASSWSISAPMKAIFLSPILLGFYFFRDKTDSTDENTRTKADLIGTSLVTIFLAGLTVKMGLDGFYDAEFLFYLLVFDTFNKRIARIGVVHFIPNPHQWQGRPRDARVFTLFLNSIVIAALGPLFLEVLGYMGIINVQWVHSPSAEGFLLAAWFVFFVFFHFHARRRALEFFQLSNASQEGIRAPRIGISFERRPYISLVFYGSLLLPALYLTLSAKDMWIVVSSWIFLWVTSNLYAWRRADVRGILFFKE